MTSGLYPDQQFTFSKYLSIYTISTLEIRLLRYMLLFDKKLFRDYSLLLSSFYVRVEERLNRPPVKYHCISLKYFQRGITFPLP